MKNLYHEIIKDYGDFIKATGDKPKKIMVTNEVFSILKENNQLEDEDSHYSFEGTSITVTDSINKDWVIV